MGSPQAGDFMSLDSGELPFDFNSLNFSESHTTTQAHVFAKLSQQERESMQEGTSVRIVITYAAMPFDHALQLAAATGTAPLDRRRQLFEEASNCRPYRIEYPIKVLVAASKTLQTYKDSDQPAVLKANFHIGHVLPGYAMFVLDWYIQALQSKSWQDFVLQEPSMVREDKWYWLFCYSAIRSLGMHRFVGDIQLLIERLIDHESLAV